MLLEALSHDAKEKLREEQKKLAAKSQKERSRISREGSDRTARDRFRMASLAATLGLNRSRSAGQKSNGAGSEGSEGKVGAGGGRTTPHAGGARSPSPVIGARTRLQAVVTGAVSSLKRTQTACDLATRGPCAPLCSSVLLSPDLTFYWFVTQPPLHLPGRPSSNDLGERNSGSSTDGGTSPRGLSGGGSSSLAPSATYSRRRCQWVDAVSTLPSTTGSSCAAVDAPSSPAARHLSPIPSGDTPENSMTTKSLSSGGARRGSSSDPGAILEAAAANNLGGGAVVEAAGQVSEDAVPPAARPAVEPERVAPPPVDEAMGEEDADSRSTMPGFVDAASRSELRLRQLLSAPASSGDELSPENSIMSPESSISSTCIGGQIHPSEAASRQTTPPRVAGPSFSPVVASPAAVQVRNLDTGELEPLPNAFVSTVVCKPSPSSALQRAREAGRELSGSAPPPRAASVSAAAGPSKEDEVTLIESVRLKV